MQPAAQFTPEQLIVAGRRAESQGQVAYALQFYRYLAEKYPNTAEAFEARDALFRLHGAEPQQQPAAAGQPQPQLQTNRPQGSVRTRPATPGEQSPPPARPQAELSVAANDRHAPAERPARQTAAQKAHPAAEASPGYRTGRFVAAILSTFGWLLLLLAVAGAGGLVFLTTVKSAPRAMQELASANLIIAAAGLVGALFAGLMAVFAGQVARATFDNADLTRWLAAVLVPDHEHHE